MQLVGINMTNTFLKTLREEEMAVVLAVQAPTLNPFLDKVDLNLRFTYAAE